MENSEDAKWKEFYEKTQKDEKLTRIDSKVQESDGGFFEKFGDQLKLTAEKTQEIVEEANRERENYQEVSTKLEDGLSESQPSITQAIECNAEDLFCDVYYQCSHLVGNETTSMKKDALLAYLKDLFEFDDAKSKTLVDYVKQKPAPKMVLKVEVCEAKDLTPKDANGFSDPFCTLGISSGTSPRVSTSTKRKTLTPVWEEHFKLDVSSPSSDILYVDVWDFDEEETLTGKFSKIKEVNGIRGVKKMFKEFIQTISAKKNDKELIGSAQITLKNIPATGQMAWFPLRKKDRNNNSGVIRMKMVFGSEKDERVALEEHRYLVKTLLKYLTKNEEFDMTMWDGSFGPEGELILRQHLAQSNLGITEDLVARFVEYVSLHLTKPINYAVLADVLLRLTTTHKTIQLTENEVTLYWNTAKKLLNSCFNMIRKIRKSAPGDKKVLVQLDAILCIIQDLSNVSIPSNVVLFPAEMYSWVQTTNKFTIKSILHEAVLNGAYDWFEYLVSHNRPENNSDEAVLRNLVKITQLISLDLQGAKQHHERLFKERLNFPYAKTLFAVYQTNIVEIAKDIVTDMCMMIKPLDFERRNEKDVNNDPLATGTTMFELFITLQNIDRLGAELFHNDDALETFAIRKYYDWFYMGVSRWLDIAAYKALQRIEKAVELDDFVPVDTTVRYSSSAIDTMAIFHQVKTFWDQLAWPDIEGSYAFVAKIIDDICKSSVHYADRIAAKVNGMGEIQNAYETKFEITPEWCAAINNIDHIHHEIEPFVRALGLEKILTSLGEFKSTVAAEHCKETLDRLLENEVENVGDKILELIETMVNKMQPLITRFLQEGAELLHQQINILDRFMQYLENSLMMLSDKLSDENFNRVLEIMWSKMSEILYILVETGIEKRRPPSFFSNLQETLQILIGYFRIEDKCTAETEQNLNDKMAQIKRLLTIYGMETPELIHFYYLQRLDEQNAIENSEDGQMAVTLQRDGDDLHIEILNARNIRAMDSNGFCDPFVGIRFLPKHKFNGVQKYGTKVQKKTLFPLFDEKFTIPLPETQIQDPNALVMFVMKDQDFYGAKNDYMAEAFLRLDSASIAGKEPYPKQIHLNLNRPSNADSDILQALDYRQGDKMARDFVKKQKTRMEVPH